MAGSSSICEEQRQLEEKHEDDGGSDSASLHEELLDMSIDEDDSRDPAVTRSASKLKSSVVKLSTVANVDKNNDKDDMSPPLTGLSITATPKGGSIPCSDSTFCPSQSAIPTGSSTGGNSIIVNDTYLAIRLFKKTAGCAPNLMGGSSCPVEPPGSLYCTGDNRHSLCFTDFRFGQKLNIMMSFNPHELECICCEGKILFEKKSGTTERRVFVLSDQCFPALATADSAQGQCLKIIRVEGGTLWELFGIYYDILRKGKLYVPAGSAVLIGSASHLLDVGLAAYAEELGAVFRRLQSLHNGCVYLIPCPMLPLGGTTNPNLVRCMIELYSWLDTVMADSVCFCSNTMKLCINMLMENSHDVQLSHRYRVLLPVSLTGLNTKKKWECGGNLLPTSAQAISQEMEATVLYSLISDLNSKLGLRLDPCPSLNREVDAVGTAGPPQIIVCGASNASRTADALERTGAEVLRAIMPGWRCMRQKAITMAELVKTTLKTARPNCVVVFQIFDTSFHFARTEDGGLVPACRATSDAKFHVHGESVVAPKESQFSAFTVAKDVLLAAAKHQIIIISPLPRYLYGKCCLDLDHCTNFSDSDYRDTIESAILSCRRNLRDFAFRHGLRGCKVICPWSTLRGHAETLWTTDPVHMSKEGFDHIANLIWEACTGADDTDNKKRPLDMPEARSGHSKKRL